MVRRSGREHALLDPAGLTETTAPSRQENCAEAADPREQRNSARFTGTMGRMALRRRHLLPIPLVLAALFAAFQYFSAEKVTNPETGRKARVGMSAGQEAALGLQSYR